MRRELLGLALVFASGCATVKEPVIAPDWAEADASKPLTHADCVRLATRSAPTAAAWRARLFAAQAAFRQAGKLPNPTLSLSWEDIGLGGGTPVQQTFSLAYELEAIFARPRLESAAQHDLEATRADLLAERAKLAADVCRAYDEVVAARRRIALADDVVAIAEEQRSVAGRFVAAGEKAHFELDRAEAESAQARADQAKARAEARAGELALAFAVGFTHPVAFDLADDLTPPVAAEPLELLTSAAYARPEIAAAEARYRAQLDRANLTAGRLQFLPAPGAGYRKTGGDRSYVTSLDVKLPIFDSGATAEEGASAELLAAAAELRRTARDVGDAVIAASERAAAAESFLNDHAAPLAARRRALREQAQRLFAAGEIEFPDVIQSLRDETDARGALLDAQLAAANARVDLAAAAGRIGGDDRRDGPQETTNASPNGPNSR